ncbi:MAG: hypothetical protein N2111_04210 [Candidatus Sumerlaeaceae bacterium]|nr:hypothetical protein [Candidatus Sumerlaeaceae bacterium]
MKLRSAVWAAVCIALIVLPFDLGAQGKQKAGASSAASPAENLLIIVADIQRHINDDVYRYPYATDVTGQNVFRAGIVRLANYETLFPGRMKDLVALAKANAFEKLGAFSDAERNYTEAQKSNDAAIRKAAGEGAERARRFAQVLRRELDQSGLRPYERDLQVLIRDADDLAEKYKGTPYAALALVERERAEMRLAEFYASMRFIHPYTTEDAILQLKRNIERNKNSKNRYSHHLMLGDLYASLARQYVVMHDPDGTDFDMKEFEGFASQARSEYFIVQQADGYPEKLEGRAKLAALEAFVERVAERSR